MKDLGIWCLRQRPNKVPHSKDPRCVSICTFVLANLACVGPASSLPGAFSLERWSGSLADNNCICGRCLSCAARAVVLPDVAAVAQRPCSSAPPPAASAAPNVPNTPTALALFVNLRSTFALTATSLVSSCTSEPRAHKAVNNSVYQNLCFCTSKANKLSTCEQLEVVDCRCVLTLAKRGCELPQLLRACVCVCVCVCVRARRRPAAGSGGGVGARNPLLKRCRSRRRRTRRRRI